MQNKISIMRCFFGVKIKERKINMLRLDFGTTFKKPFSDWHGWSTLGSSEPRVIIFSNVISFFFCGALERERMSLWWCWGGGVESWDMHECKLIADRLCELAAEFNIIVNKNFLIYRSKHVMAVSEGKDGSHSADQKTNPTNCAVIYKQKKSNGLRGGFVFQ